MPPGRTCTVDASVDPYATLGVTRTASADEIRAAWKKAVLRNHPDKVGDDGTAFRRVQSAYEMLRVESKKPLLDRKRTQRRREYEQRRREMTKWKDEEREAQERDYVERREKAQQAKDAFREAEEKRRREKQQTDRRIAIEGRAKYEARMAREQHAAYMEKCRVYNEQQAAKRREYKAQQGKSWADRQADRHNERFQSRLRRYHHSTLDVPEAESKACESPTGAGGGGDGNGGDGGSSGSVDGSGAVGERSANGSPKVQSPSAASIGDLPVPSIPPPGKAACGLSGVGERAASPSPSDASEALGRRAWLPFPWEMMAQQTMWERRQMERDAIRRHFTAATHGVHGHGLEGLQELFSR